MYNPNFLNKTGISPVIQQFTLMSADISNGYVTLSSAPSVPSDTILLVANAGNLFFNVDFTVSGTQLIWNSEALSGILSVGDTLTVIYSS